MKQDKLQKKLDKATRALLDMGPVAVKEPKFAKADLNRKFRLHVNRKEKRRLEQLW